MDEKIKEFVALCQQQYTAYINQNYSGLDTSVPCYQVHSHTGKKYIRVDFGDSGKYMVDPEGRIWGIKAYGVPHFGHQYGTLDTMHDYYWGGYTATRKRQPNEIVFMDRVRENAKFIK